jgi:hypothetical protein
VVANTGGLQIRGWKTRDGRWEKTNGSKAKANPATRMDGIAKESGSSRSGLKSPRVEAPIKGNAGEASTAVETGRKVNEEEETRELKMRG